MLLKTEGQTVIVDFDGSLLMALVHILGGHSTYQSKHVATDTQCGACLNRLAMLTVRQEACQCAAQEEMVQSEHIQYLAVYV